MANVKIPLMSASAQGSIGSVLTFSRRKGRQKVRFQRKQSYDATDNQISHRLLVAQAVDSWQDLTNEQKEVWNRLALGKSKSGYNMFISNYLNTTDPVEKRSIFGKRSYGYFNYGRQVI